MTDAAPPTLTNEQLAELLGYSSRTIPRWRKRGLPMPAAAEDLQAWAARAKEWIAGQRRPAGRPRERSAVAVDQEARLLKARADKAELQVLEMRGALHSRAQCEREHVRRMQEFRVAMLGLGVALARKVQHQTPDVVQGLIDDAVRERLTILAEGLLPSDHDHDTDTAEAEEE